MRSKRNPLLIGVTFLSVLGTIGATSLADSGTTIKVGKRGTLVLTSTTRIAEVSLKSGAYQVRHVIEGEDHFMVFRRIGRPGGYGPMVPGKVVARVKCELRPLGRTAKRMEVHTAPNTAGESTIQEILVKGENVRHVF